MQTFAVTLPSENYCFVNFDNLFPKFDNLCYNVGEMKEFLKKSWRYLIFIPILAVILVAVILNLPKEKTTLELTVADITLKVGEKGKISYESNIKEADFSFSIEDKDIAVIDDKELVTGLAVGQTKLVVVAEYENQLATKNAVVTIVDEPEAQEKPMLTIKSGFNEISELDLVVGEKVLISVEANYDFEYNSSPEIVVEEVTGVAKHYLVSATMAGEYKIIFTCQELVKVLDVIVKIK